MIKVLFVCLGNICRSPMADGVFQNLVNEAGLGDEIMVDSAGTASYHVGERAHQGTRDILNKHDIPYDGRARQLAQRDLNDYDYVLAMDASNLRNIRHYVTDNTHAEVRLFLSYANDAHKTNVEEVPDPYYDDRFDYVYDLVTTGSKALLAHIRKEHGL